jgi:GDP-4-dehydro-6-deoxy-D-mannose reductase
VKGVLVTGAGGFAGTHLVNLLTRAGESVIGWRRADIDLLDRDAVRNGVAEVRPSVVYHLGGAAHVGASWTDTHQTLAANVLGTHHLLDGLRMAGISARVLIPGSSYVYRQSARAISEDDPIEPASPYALSKLAQEMLGRRAIAEDRQQVFLTRSFNHIGPGQAPSFAASGFARQVALIEAGLADATIAAGNLDSARDLTDVRDTVSAYRAIVERGRAGEPYNVCSGTAYKIRDVLDRVLAMSRVPIAIRIDPARYRPSDNPVLLGNPARILREVGWRPSIPLDRTLEDLLGYWRKEVEYEEKAKQ